MIEAVQASATPPQEALLSPEDQQALREVTQHSAENPMPAWPGRKCVDGRYQAGQGSGMISRPGADFGYIMVLLAINKEKKLGLTPQECVDKVRGVVTKNGGKFFMHSDQHADPVLPQPNHNDHAHVKQLTGCGHITNAANPELALAYGVDPDDVKQAHIYAKSIAQVEEVPLYGEHEERDVIAITGTKRTVSSFDQHRNRMYFVYDKARDGAFMDELVPQLGIEGVTIEEFKAAAGRQMNETLRLLAPGRRIFTVNVDGSVPKVDLASRVTSRASAAAPAPKMAA
ncbi:MAG: hypothetical protein HY428_00095 [Candidatus Levybacteria bacterium]|nr:hypothetical protein [Candidatus Levybacteria bacterium]